MSIIISCITLFHFILAITWWRPGSRCCTKKHLPGEEPFPKGLVLFTPLFSKFWFDISLIWGLVDFRLHNHRYLQIIALDDTISNLTGKRLKSVNQSAISDHLFQCNCTINSDHFDILAAEFNKFKLLVVREGLDKTWQTYLKQGDKILSIGAAWLRWQFYFYYSIVTCLSGGFFNI